MQAADTAPIPRGRNFLLWTVLGIGIAALGSVLIAVSQGTYYYGDEGFHLLASQLLITGKRVYLDFFFQHPPVYTYLNAGWMLLAGDTWRSAHLFSALLAIICAAMIGGYLFSRFDRRDGQLVFALGGVLFFMLNPLVVCYAVLGQPYALCLVWLFGAFLLAVRSTNQPRFSAVWA
ncbi:MAG: hypothetical protein JWO45_452, partial [Spartobacteria bacterium]|nr:hypothetical protein [Spartobacteria bacterium]